MIKYRTKDGRADYAFSFEQRRDGSWLAYIEAMPSYGALDDSFATTHRLPDGGRTYVCWTEPLWTEKDVRAVAALWADSTQTYLRTGQFP